MHLTHAHTVLHRRPVRVLARCAVVVLALGALTASRLDPVPHARPQLCAGPCGSPALISREVA